MKIAVLIDGGFLRVQAKKAHKIYDPDFIERFAHACKGMDEQIFRILYYDCAQYNGTVKLPVSGGSYTFQSNPAWLDALSYKDLFAVRRGVLKFRGFVPRGRRSRVRLFRRPSPMQTSSPSLNRRASTCGLGSMWPRTRQIGRWIASCW